ncbi:activator-dependent family glycosyltransferase [Streptosporangium sp. NPDC050855]|uniref:activator-dependent family glycosyltransferase n=1 Tax=Streptosporangium sp. NPDC050855 TaxID=3366194 RepID=UPI0037946B61
MRVLFTSHAEKSHFLGMVPLAWALRNAGHEVRVASQPELTDVITGAGLTAVPVGTDHELRRMTQVMRRMKPDAPAFDMAEDRPEVLTWEHLRWGYDGVVPWWWRVVNDPMIAGLTEYCRQWEPDLVIWEPLTYAGSIAAKACGAAHARFMWGLDLTARMRGHYLRVMAQQPPGARRDVLAEWLGARAERFGVPFSEDMTTGQFTIDYTPGSLRLDLPLTYVPLRYIPYNGVAVVPPWLHVPPAKPRVCLTLGTSATERLDGYSVDVQDILTHLADLDIELVATLPQKQQGELRHVPDNVRLVSFVPLHALTPTCSVMIHHGGGGSFSTSVVNAVPQLILADMFDAPLKGELLAQQGAGLTLHSSQATGPRVREHLLRLLNEPSFTQAAQRLRQETLATPGPNQIVPELERLTARHRGGAVSRAAR